MLGLKKRGLITVAVVVVLTVYVFGCAKILNTTDDSTKASADTVAFIDEAMPKLVTILRKWQNGEQMGAVKLWKSMGRVPSATVEDSVLSDDYLEYANNVRYYMLGDGSATMRDVEDSRQNVEYTLESLRP